MPELQNVSFRLKHIAGTVTAQGRPLYLAEILDGELVGDVYVSSVHGMPTGELSYQFPDGEFYDLGYRIDKLRDLIEYVWDVDLTGKRLAIAPCFSKSVRCNLGDKAKEYGIDIIGNWENSTSEETCVSAWPKECADWRVLEVSLTAE